MLLAADGLDAMQLFEDHRERIVAVISDVQMPRVDGRQLVEGLHRQKRELPVILISGHTGEVDVSELVKRAEVSWLEKPLKVENFEAELKRMLNSSGGE